MQGVHHKSRIPVCCSLPSCQSAILSTCWYFCILTRVGTSDMTARTNTWFAVAVRDEADLWLYLEIKRSRKSDVYVFEPDWPAVDVDKDFHISLHADGRWHAKSSYGAVSAVHRQKKPSAKFIGSEPLVTTPIHLSGVRAYNKPCRHARSGAEYIEVFEIPPDEISRGRGSIARLLQSTSPPPESRRLSRILFGIRSSPTRCHISTWCYGILTERLKTLEARGHIV